MYNIFFIKTSTLTILDTGLGSMLSIIDCFTINVNKHFLRRCSNSSNRSCSMCNQCFNGKIDLLEKSKKNHAFFHDLLKAVNGPLQQRTNVLDLDFSRSNTFPTDYDTDIESPWSNPSKHSLLM